MAGPRTRVLIIGARFLIATVTFVRSIAAIVFGVAFPTVRNASAIGATEMRGATSYIRAIHFVAVITAVIFVVTFEGARDATQVLALEFRQAARWY